MADSSSPIRTISSLLQQGQRTGAQYGKVLERLSSGLRINRTSDDSGGAALATKLTSDSAVYKKGAESAETAITLFQVASEATDALTSVITRMREITAANEISGITISDRLASQDELEALSSEYSRIVLSTEFNGQRVFGSQSGSIAAQIGPARGDVSKGNLFVAYSEVTGSGTFGSVTTVSTVAGASIYHIMAADLDADGNQDLIYSNQAAGTGMGVRLGNGDGSFQTLVTYASTDGIFTVTTGDINGDGNLDIIGGGDGLPARLVTYLGNGDGTFRAQVTYALGDPNANVTVGDINGDGIDDVVASAQGASNYFRVYYGSTSGTLSLGTTISLGGVSPSNPELVDLNNDGYLDLVGVSGAVGARYLKVFMNNGDGTFASGVTYTSSNVDYTAVQSGDINNDGNADILTGDAVNGRFTVFLGNGSGTLTAGQSYLGSGAGQTQWPRLGDINGDGNLDVVANNVTSNSITVNLGNGDGTFGAPVAYTNGGNTTDPWLADFNNDGALDFASGVVGNQNIQLRLAVTSSVSRSGVLETSLDSLSVLTRTSAAAADNYLDKIQSNVSRIGSLANAGQVSFGVASFQAEASGQTLQDGAQKILDVDAATDLANNIRLSLLISTQQGLLASANLSVVRVAKLLGTS